MSAAIDARLAIGSIPLVDPFRGQYARKHLEDAIEHGHLHGGGPFSARCEAYLKKQHSSVAVFLTSSCTSALELAAQTLAIGPGDEVLLPTYTFVSCATAFCSYGATPVFCDIDATTLNISPEEIRAKISRRTRAVVVVHYAGISAEMESIAAICSEHDVQIIEDNAHGLFGTCRGHLLGTMGALATLSFDQQKNYSCGEGGALLVNLASVLPRAETAINCGTNRAAFDRGEQKEYVWVGEGSKRRPSELQAALLWSQFECREAIQAGRKCVWDFYLANLQSWAAQTQVRLPHVAAGCNPAFQLFYVLMPSIVARDAMIASLRSKGIGCGFHFIPLHLSPAGKRYGWRQGDCPVAENIAERLVRLPCYPHLTTSQLERIVEALVHFLP